MNILRPSSKRNADLVAECFCGCLFEYGYADMTVGHSDSVHSFSGTPQGRIYVDCPSCRGIIEVGSYELRISVARAHEMRRGVTP